MAPFNSIEPSILERIYPYYKKVNREGFSKWFCLLNNISLLPIFLWPLIFFGSIFLFDNPQNFFLTFVIFILTNSYPLVLLKISVFSYRLFKTNRIVGVSIAILTTMCWIITLFLLSKDS